MCRFFVVVVVVWKSLDFLDPSVWKCRDTKVLTVLILHFGKRLLEVLESLEFEEF